MEDEECLNWVVPVVDDLRVVEKNLGLEFVVAAVSVGFPGHCWIVTASALKVSMIDFRGSLIMQKPQVCSHFEVDFLPGGRRKEECAAVGCLFVW